MELHDRINATILAHAEQTASGTELEDNDSVESLSSATTTKSGNLFS